ncbi:hypothetical protein O988_08007 [Pseudogymnoascus sp. VKM F-3808]|nr:hypothetical protein O988_08007 [Pseudogymnoascus sp. VKM F-3808]
MVREIVSQKIRGRLLFLCLFGGFLCAEKGQEKKKPTLGIGTHVVLLGGIHTNTTRYFQRWRLHSIVEFYANSLLPNAPQQSSAPTQHSPTLLFAKRAMSGEN